MISSSADERAFRQAVVSCALFLIAVAGQPLSVAAQTQKISDPPEAQDMRLVGYNDLQARSAYQPTIHKQGSRYIAYIGHHGGTDAILKPVNPLTGQPEDNGTSILDVTDPANPKYLKHLPGLEGTYEAGGAQMVRVCDGASLPKGERNAVYMLRVFGGKAHEIWDVAEPANPKLITRIPSGKDTHKNWWECDTGIAYLVSGEPSWRTRRMTQVYDLSDPANPVKIRDFGLPGQQPGAEGAVPTELHGPISTGPQGNRVYFGYGTNKGGILQIVDRDKLLNGPKEPTPDNLRYPVVRPMIISSYTANEARGNFCQRGGRFGSHSSNESMAPIFYKKLAVIAFFNAGVRVIDVRDPYHPKEVAFFIPAITEATDKRCLKIDGQERCKTAIQTNNVETDDRGYIYIVDRANTGMHILELTGEAKRIAMGQ